MIFMLILILEIILCLIFILTDNKYASELVSYAFLFLIITAITTCSVNESVVPLDKKIHHFTALNNTTQVEGRGGLFHTAIDEKDYLVFWQDKGTHFERKKVEIDWNITKVYESDSEKPRIEIAREARKDTRKHFWFDLDSGLKNTGYNIYVPVGTVIREIRLE